MRLILVLAALAGFAIPPAVGPAHAETRMFIIANQPDGYGIDRCLANGEACGQAAARTYCRSQQFTEAARFTKVAADEVTGSVPAGPASCDGPKCAAFVAITCQR